MRKYKYLQIGIASPEEIISWANPVLQGRKFTYDPLHKDKVTAMKELEEYMQELSSDICEMIEDASPEEKQ